MEQKDEKVNIVHILRHVTSHAMSDRLALSDKLFQVMDSSDFMLMLILAKHCENSSDKIYMKDLAQQTKLPMRKVSNIVKTLSSQEWVSWSFDGNGEEGTYVKLTELGLDVTKKQKKILQNFYNQVIEQFGEERFVKMFKDIADLEEVMKAIIDEMEDVQ